MPLITCTDCGREISDAATSCPQCGRPKADSTLREPSPTEASSKQPVRPLTVVLVLLLAGLLLFLYIVAQVGSTSTRSVGTRPMERNVSVTYEVSGTACSASVTYSTSLTSTQQEASVPMGWTHSLTIAAGNFVQLMAQNNCDSGSVTATIKAGGRVVDSATSTGGFAIAHATGVP